MKRIQKELANAKSTIDKLEHEIRVLNMKLKDSTTLNQKLEQNRLLAEEKCDALEIHLQKVLLQIFQFYKRLSNNSSNKAARSAELMMSTCSDIESCSCFSSV